MSIITAIDPSLKIISPVYGRGESVSIALRKYNISRWVLVVSITAGLSKRLGFVESRNFAEVGHSPEAGVLVVANANGLDDGIVRYQFQDRNNTKTLALTPSWFDPAPLGNIKATSAPFTYHEDKLKSAPRVAQWIEVELPDWAAPGRVSRMRAAKAAGEARAKFEAGGGRLGVVR